MPAQEKKETWVRKVVTARDAAYLSDLREALKASDGRIIKELPLINGYLCEFPKEGNVLAEARILSEKVRVEDDITFKLCLFPALVAPRSIFPFPAFPKPVQLPPVAPPAPVKGGRIVDWGLKRIGAPKVWGKLKERRVRVGIIDTGINYYHPDLRRNVRDGTSTLDGQASFLDDYGHGTHIAGIIGACNVNGMVGINPYVDFYVVKAFKKDGSGNLSDIVEGMDWLIRRQVSVINMSFSTSETSEAIIRAVKAVHARGILMVAAAGNDGQEVNFPARLPEVIAVSAIDKNDQLASFSSYGLEINFCAPGVDVYSDWLGTGYSRKSGTSFAAPHVTGAVADIINYYGPLPSSRLREMMSEKAVILENLGREQQGHGLLELPRLIDQT
ncbi:MAG: S8 family peptidase [Peptococcaceae bacterium]|nr:S8 family peptidase [Peptococcaceae bacterium]MDH7524179.1 S8 family peptidase [Peptococcaceae bacterium]